MPTQKHPVHFSNRSSLSDDLSGNNLDFIPLKDFRTRFDPTKGAVPDVVLSVESLAEARIESDRQFNQFYRLVGAQVAVCDARLYCEPYAHSATLKYNALTIGNRDHHWYFKQYQRFCTGSDGFQ